MVRESLTGITISIVEESWSATLKLRAGKLWNLDTKKTIGGLLQLRDSAHDGLPESLVEKHPRRDLETGEHVVREPSDISNGGASTIDGVFKQVSACTTKL